MSYHIRANDTFYYLDATTKITHKESAKLSKNPLYNNSTSSDHYINDLPTITMSGILSDIKGYGARSDKSSTEYIDGLNAVKKSSSPVWLKYRLDRAEEYGWFITSLETSQDNQQGYSGIDEQGNIVQSFKVSIVLQKPLVTGSLNVNKTPKRVYTTNLQEKSSSSQAMQGFPDDATNQEKAEYLGNKADDIFNSKIKSAFTEEE